MTEQTPISSQLARITSGIPGLDLLLHGGFIRGAIYIVMGPPGAGKTIFGNQLCFHHIAEGGRAVYITLLAETHAAMLNHLQTLDFFDPQVIANSLNYYSAYDALDEGGMQALLDMIRQVLRDQQPSLLVIDGLATVKTIAESELAFKRFVHQLQLLSSAHGCTTFMLTHVHQDYSSHPEHTMVDGLVLLTVNLLALRSIREVHVLKIRGTDFVGGKHLFDITRSGITIYPRLEALTERRYPALTQGDLRHPFHIEQLDQMLRGGLPDQSSTMIIGTTGSGKTLLGLQFLAAGAQQGEPGLFFGLYETPAVLQEKARHIGLNLSPYLDAGQIHIAWHPPLNALLDRLVQELLHIVREHNIRRLYIDGLEGLERVVAYPERIPHILSALIHELRQMEVTVVFASELPGLFDTNAVTAPKGVSILADNILFLRHVELRSQTYRLLSIVKMRQSGYESAMREFTITDTGIRVAETSESAETILAGIAHPPGGKI